MKITEEIRESIITHLPKGYAKKVADQCGVSEATVYRVMHHEHANEPVANALVELARETQKEAAAKHRKLVRLAKQLSQDKAA